MTWYEICASVLLILGAFLMLTGGVGILRMRDFYCRVHPAGKNDTLGQFLLLGGLMFLVDWPSEWVIGGKLVLIILFVFITTPTATHAITKAAWTDGLRPEADEDTSQDAIPEYAVAKALDGSPQAGDLPSEPARPSDG